MNFGLEKAERAAASARRRPAARVPQVRFERALRRLRPEIELASDVAIHF